MTATPASVDLRADPLGENFDAFLYCVIQEDESGQSLTVLSLLARQNIDAWDAAGEYMRSPREAAITKFSDLLAKQVARTPADEASRALAARLLGLLPEPRCADPVRPSEIWPAIVRSFGRIKNATRVWIQSDRR
jgi:hypothetical protein